MKQQSEKDKEIIIDFFKKEDGEYWKTVDEIAKGTGLPAAIIIKAITNSGDFVRSSYRQKAGEPLFTTREIFRDKAPFVDKMIGAFKNRID